MGLGGIQRSAQRLLGAVRVTSGDEDLSGRDPFDDVSLGCDGLVTRVFDAQEPYRLGGAVCGEQPAEVDLPERERVEQYAARAVVIEQVTVDVHGVVEQRGITSFSCGAGQQRVGGALALGIERDPERQRRRCGRPYEARYRASAACARETHYRRAARRP